MSDNLESIIKDLYELDPTLREKDGEVRVIVTALLAKKPKVSPAAAFTRDLRQTLLATASVGTIKAKGAIVSPFPWQWWVTRLLPVGAVALLFFMLIPSQTSHAPGVQTYESTPATPTTPSISEDPELVNIPGTESVSMKRSLPVADEAVSVPETVDVMVHSAKMANDQELEGIATESDNRSDMRFMAPAESLSVKPLQVLSIYKSEPLLVVVDSMSGQSGFVVARKVEGDDGLGNIVAISPYLREGFQIPLTLSKRADLEIGAVYSVGIYTDSQASVSDIGWFNKETDPLVTESEVRFWVDYTGMLVIRP